MILNYLENAFVGQSGVKKIYTGEELIWPNEKQINLSWNFLNWTVTAYDPQVNDNDRPRINTFRSDGTFIIYLSAGDTIYNPTTSAIGTVQPYQIGPTQWGNRLSGTEVINIPLTGILFAGIDFFTQDTLTSPYFVPPLEEWDVSTTGNEGEVKYQLQFNRLSEKNLNIYIGSVPPI
jgi:hypothetical protein